MSVAAAVSDAAIAVREKLRGRVGQTKVKRYWPGRAPEWADDTDEGRGGVFADAKDEEMEEGEREQERVPRMPMVVDDPRLRRLGEVKKEREEVVARHREIRAAEIVSELEEEQRSRQVKEEQEQEEEDDEDAIEERRQRIRAALLQRQREQEEAEAAGEAEMEEGEEEEEEEEEESEYETDSEEEGGGLAMVRPLFVPKAERETLTEKEKQEEEERQLEEAVKRRLDERKGESRQMVVEEVRKEEEREKGALDEDAKHAEDIDTDDDENPEEEFEAWRLREIARIKREREEREVIAKEKEEREKLAAMTEEERREWERKNPKQLKSAPKKKWKFMQKYWHKGAFYQEAPDAPGGKGGGEDIFTRDYSAPTGEDKMDKTILPSVMQVKHFGRSGRSKWTHLVNEDTTSWDSPWTHNDPLRARYNSRMAGMDRPIERPKGKKGLKDW